MSRRCPSWGKACRSSTRCATRSRCAPCATPRSLRPPRPKARELLLRACPSICSARQVCVSSYLYNSVAREGWLHVAQPQLGGRTWQQHLRNLSVAEGLYTDCARALKEMRQMSALYATRIPLPSPRLLLAHHRHGYHCRRPLHRHRHHHRVQPRPRNPGAPGTWPRGGVPTRSRCASRRWSTITTPWRGGPRPDSAPA